MTLKKLRSDVRAKIQSGLIITDATQCVLELVENSLDAGATTIAVETNLNKYMIKVMDNGVGISYEDLRLIGKRYMTSKCHMASDLNKTMMTYGYRGQAIPSLLDSCSVLTIKTKHEKNGNTFIKIFKNGKASPISLASKENIGSGTTVTVCDFMSTMPVRRKRISEVFDLGEIKNQLRYLAVIHNEVCFTLRDKSKGAILLQTRRTSNAGSSLSDLFNLAIEKFLVPLNHTESNYEINGFISLKKRSDCNFQLLYVNKRIVFTSLIHEVINNLIDKYLKANEDLVEDFFHKQGLWLNIPKDSHNVYVIQIRCPYSLFEIFKCSRKTAVEFNNWDDVLKALQKSIELAFAFSGEGDIITCGGITSISLSSGNPTLNDVRRTHGNFDVQGTAVKRKLNNAKYRNEERFALHGHSQLDRSMIGAKKVIRMGKKSTTEADMYKLVENEWFGSTTGLPSSQFGGAEDDGEGKSLPESPIPSERTIRSLKSRSALRRDLKRKAARTDDCEYKYFFLDFLSWFASQIRSNSNAFELYNEFLRSKLDYSGHRIEESNLISNKRKLFSGIKDKEKRRCDRVPVKPGNDDEGNHVSRVTNKRGTDSGPSGSKGSSEIKRKPKGTCIHFQGSKIKFADIKKKGLMPNISNGTRITHKVDCDKEKTTDKNLRRAKKTDERQECRTATNSRDNTEKERDPEVITERVPNARTELSNLTDSSESWVSHCQKSVGYSRENGKNGDVELKRCNSTAVNRILRGGDGSFIETEEQKCDSPGQGHFPLPFHRSFSFPWTRTDKLFVIGMNTRSFNEEHEKLVQVFQENTSGTEMRTPKETLVSSSFVQRDDRKRVGQEQANQDKNDGQNEEASRDLTRDSRLDGPLNASVTVEKSFTGVRLQVNADPVNSVNSGNTVIQNEVERRRKELKNVKASVNSIDSSVAFREVTRGKATITNSNGSNVSISENACSIVSTQNEIEEPISKASHGGASAFGDGSSNDGSSFNFAGRYCFIPKGLSQTIVESKSVNMSEPNTSNKRELEDLCHDSDHAFLETVKWMGPRDGDKSVNEIMNKMCDIAEENMVFYERPIATTALSKSASNVHGLLDTFSLEKNLFATTIKIIGQWDMKFILATIDVSSVTGMQLLIIFDQHAVDERIRVEKLLKRFRTEDGKFIARDCSPPVRCVLNESIVHFIPSLEKRLIDFGVGASVEDSRTVLLHKVPLCLTDEKRNMFDNRDVTKFIHRLLVDVVEDFKDTRGSVSKIPSPLYNLISARACRGAVKFNQFLSREDMKKLIDDLILCQFPFQCAHGRPSVLAIMDLRDMKLAPEGRKLNFEKFYKAGE